VSKSAALLLLACCLFGAVPVWLSIFPPMVDLPQHAAQVGLFRDLHHPAFRYAGDFRINWFTPYLLGYLQLFCFSSLAGPVVAAKIVVSIALFLAPIFLAFLLWDLESDPLLAVITVPAMYGITFAWGFLNYLVAAPIGIALLWCSLRHLRQANRRTYIGVFLLGLLLFFSHALIWAFFVFVCALWIVLESQTRREGLRRALPLLLPIPLIFVFLAHSLAAPISSSGVNHWDLGWVNASEPYYGNLTPHWGRLFGFMARLLGAYPTAFTNLFGIVLFALPSLAGYRPQRRAFFWVPFVTCLVVLFAAPSTLFRITFIYQRFSLFVLPFFVIGISRVANPKSLVRWTMPLVASTWIAVVCVNTLAANSGMVGLPELIAHMRPGERALSLVFQFRTPGSIAPVYVHLPHWYAGEKADAVVDPSFAEFPQEWVVFRDGRVPNASVGFEWTPREFDWTYYSGANYRYFVVRAAADYGPALFRNTTCNVSLRYHQASWYLYERADDCDPKPNTPAPQSTR
jgi:hypothetical protein